MKLSQAKGFHIRGFNLTHRVLRIIYFGIQSRTPEISEDKIQITFSGTKKIDLPVDFMADALELENDSTPIAEFEFLTRPYKLSRFVFKNNTSIIGTVDAWIVKVEVIEHPPRIKREIG
jgi:hypothetical protein